MTATADLPPRTTIGPRERRRLEQSRRSRRRYRQAALVMAVAVAVAALLGAGARLLDAPSPQGSKAAEPGAGAGTGSGGRAESATATAGGSEAPADGSAAPAGGSEAPADGSEGPADERVRVQLLNGVGTPGVADGVEERLPEGEFRVVVADNAPEFGVRRTRLLVYDDDSTSLAAAERLREVLGAGTIAVSRQPQSVVDVTVIIGRDLDGS